MSSSFDAPRSFSLIADRSSGWSGTPAVELSADGRPLTTWRQLEPQLGPTHSTSGSATRPSSPRCSSRSRSTPTASCGRAPRCAPSDGTRSTCTPSACCCRCPRARRRGARLHGPLERRAPPAARRTARRHLVAAGPPRPPGSRRAVPHRRRHPGIRLPRGEVWAAHVAWSGNQELLVERLPEGAGVHAAVLGGGELLDAGEIRLAPGEEYVGPRLVLVYSGDGLDGATARLHRSLRARPGASRAPRARCCSTPGRPSTSTTTSARLDPARRRRRRGRRRTVRARRRLVPRPPRRHVRPRRLVRRRRTSGPTACGRSPSTCTSPACSSVSGSSPRW